MLRCSLRGLRLLLLQQQPPCRHVSNNCGAVPKPLTASCASSSSASSPSAAPSRPVPLPLSSYLWSTALDTRWADNDSYGHINNVAYLAFFDTAINRFLAAECGQALGSSPLIGLAVQSGCSYFAPASFPEQLTVGLRVAQRGRSSVRYELGVFRAGQGERPCAQGFFVHAFVDATSRRPVKELPEQLAAGLSRLQG